MKDIVDNNNNIDNINIYKQKTICMVLAIDSCLESLITDDISSFALGCLYVPEPGRFYAARFFLQTNTLPRVTIKYNIPINMMVSPRIEPLQNHCWLYLPPVDLKQFGSGRYPWTCRYVPESGYFKTEGGRYSQQRNWNGPVLALYRYAVANK